MLFTKMGKNGEEQVWGRDTEFCFDHADSEMLIRHLRGGVQRLVKLDAAALLPKIL